MKHKKSALQYTMNAVRDARGTIALASDRGSMDSKDYQRFLALRRRAMEESESAWSFCKTPLPAMIGDSEFRVAMVFPDCYREREEGRSDKPCGFYIEQSYYSGDGWIKIRVWSGETFSEALDKFETDINK